MSALYFEKTSAFRFNTSLRDFSSLSDSLPFRCSISGKTGLFASNYVSVSLLGKFEELDSLSSICDFVESACLKDFINLFSSVYILCWHVMDTPLNLFKFSTL